MKSLLRILYLEDDRNDVELVQAKLEEEGFAFHMTHVETEADFIAALERGVFDIILADYKLPAFDGLSALAIARTRTPGVPFIFLSGNMGEELAIETLKNGATDYVLKQRAARLGPAIRRALKEAEEHLERRKAEEELEKYREHLEELVESRTKELQRVSNDLSRSNADLQQFAYIVSHDLQEPLHVIRGFLGLIARRYHDKLDEKGHEFIALTTDSAKRMQELIQGLLDYSRVGHKLKEFKPAESSLILDKVFLNLKAAIEESRAQVTCNGLPTVMADSLQLGSLFQNLVGNAIKFHGTEPPKVHVSAEKREGEWLFSVRDNGIGIDPKFSEEIFSVFQRLHTSAEYPGTGIGLAICKKIVERHGGRIWVESDPGKWTTFFFTIPE